MSTSPGPSQNTTPASTSAIATTIKPTDLRGILKYVPRFQGQIFVIAIDGSIVADDNFGNLLVDLAVLRSLGIKIVLVHGISHQIKELAAAHYNGPARDGTRPGVFWVPLPGSPYRIVSMRSLTYHEAIPGHHFQVALQQEMASLPRFRQDRIFGGATAHSEGWALYAEHLAAESGWYEGDIVGHLGQLDDELFRARRLVVDTGLHAMKWTRQQAIDYGIKATEVERYVVNAGQACAYKIGMLKILELRARARQALGDRFSLKEFHNTVLRAGNMPLAVLEQVIDDWIADSR
jgi:uncharacterized protein (DUF885 family)